MRVVLPQRERSRVMTSSCMRKNQVIISPIIWMPNGVKLNHSKKRMAHGTLVLTIAIGLTADVINEVCMTYGYDRIRFIKPVFIDDTIYVITKIREKKNHKKPGFGLITEQVEAFNQDSDLVMVCDHIYLAEKRREES